MTTVSEKLDALRTRAAAQKAIEAKIAQAVDGDERAFRGCGFCALFRRRNRHVRMLDVDAVDDAGASTETTADAAASNEVARSAAHTRLFGIKGMSLGKKKNADPSAKLREAALALEERIGQLEVRASEGRAEAKRCMQANQKAAAIRALKKAKAVEKQLLANQSSLDALEAQLSLLEDAAVQKTLASALASSSKNFKKQRGILSQAESAIDEAADTRDVVVELQDVMSEFAASGTDRYADDDELVAELEGMMSDEAPAPAAAPSSDAAGDAMRALENKHADYDAAAQLARDLPVTANGAPRPERPPSANGAPATSSAKKRAESQKTPLLAS